MPNDDSTPEMFENRNGLSSVTTVSSQAVALPFEPQMHFVRADVARQAHVAIDRVAIEQLQVAARQALEEVA